MCVSEYGDDRVPVPQSVHGETHIAVSLQCVRCVHDEDRVAPPRDVFLIITECAWSPCVDGGNERMRARVWRGPRSCPLPEICVVIRHFTVPPPPIQLCIETTLQKCVCVFIYIRDLPLHRGTLVDN